MLPFPVRQNLCIVYGCKPTGVVDASTKMMGDLKECLWYKINGVTLTCRIPNIFELI